MSVLVPAENQPAAQTASAMDTPQAEARPKLQRRAQSSAAWLA
jgi:hypothetical protein